MTNPYAPKEPFFPQVQRKFLTEDELDRTIDVVLVSVYGMMTYRGEHRKEVLEKPYEAEIEVPADYNKGHVKLGINRHIRRHLHGIRARTFNVDREVEPKPAEHKRRVRDFMSDKGLRDNDRVKREYEREMVKRKQEQDAMAQGMAPVQPLDSSEYGPDGLPKFSDRIYVA